MKLFDHHLQGWASNKDIENTVLFIVSNSDEESKEHDKPLHSRLFKVYTKQKINVWYDFGADYYFFEDASK